MTSVLVERLDALGCEPVALAEVLPRVARGELIILRRSLQALGYSEAVEGVLLDIVRPVLGPDRLQHVLDTGWHQIHQVINHTELIEIGKHLKKIWPVGLQFMKALVRQTLGVTGEFFLQENHNLRLFLPQDVWQRGRQDYMAYETKFNRGKLTLHGVHQDTSYYHPLNGIGVWTAIGPVSKENGMTFFPDLFGQNLPRAEDGCVRGDQVLGKALTFTLQPGDSILFHLGQFHGSVINQTPHTRVVMSGRFVVGKPELFDWAWHNYLSADEIPEMIGRRPPPFAHAEGRQPRLPAPTLDTSAARTPVTLRQGREPGCWEFPAQELAVGEVRPLDERYCVVRNTQGCFAICRQCPHEGADLACGHVRGDHLHCPRHDLAIDLATGRSPCQTLPTVEAIPCRISNGSVKVRLPTTAPPAQLSLLDRLRRWVNRG